MSVRSRDSREGARRHADSAEVKDLSHQFGSLSLSDSKKGESENEKRSEVMQQESEMKKSSQISGDVMKLRSRDVMRERNSSTKEDSEGTEKLGGKQDEQNGRTLSNKGDTVSISREDPVSSNKHKPVSNKNDEAVSSNKEDHVLGRMDDPLSKDSAGGPVPSNSEKDPVAKSNKDEDPASRNIDNSEANKKGEVTNDSDRRPGEPDVESHLTETWLMKLTGLTGEVSWTELTTWMNKVMSAPVKIPIQYKAGDADVTFHVRSDKPDIDWQDVMQKLKTPTVSSMVKSAQLQPVTDCVSVAWFSDKVTYDYLEVYITNAHKTSMPDSCEVNILQFTYMDKTAVVQFKGSSGADVARLCSKSHTLSDQPLTINPWFGSVENLSLGGAESNPDSCRSPCGQTEASSDDLKKRLFDNTSSEERFLHEANLLTEWRRDISQSELPGYRLLQKLWGSSVRNIVIDTDERKVLIHGTPDVVADLKESLQSQMYFISNQKEQRRLSKAMLTVLVQAGGETLLEDILAEEDIIAAVGINFELLRLEVFVSSDAQEAEAAITHILQRKVVEDTVSLARYPGLRKEEDVKLICDRLNVATEFHHSTGQPCNIKLHGFRADVQKAAEKLRSNFTEILLPEHIDKITGAELLEADGLAYDQLDASQSRSEMNNSPGDSQPHRSPGGQSARPKSRAENSVRMLDNPSARSNHPHRSRNQSSRWAAQPARSSQWPKTENSGRRWETQSKSTDTFGRSQFTPEKSTKEFTFSQNDFPSLGSPNDIPPRGSPPQRPGEQSLGGMGIEKENAITSHESLTASELRYIQEFLRKNKMKKLQSDLRKYGGDVELLKESKEIKWTYPSSKESKVNPLLKTFLCEFITKHHRIDIEGIYQFFTETSNGQQSLRQLEGSHECTIEVCKLRRSSPGVPASDASGGNAQQSTQKAGSKSKVNALGKKCVNIIKKGAQSLKASAKKAWMDKEMAEEYLFGKLRVIICQGNIINTEATVLVNVLTPEMNLSVGLSKAVCEAAGFSLKKALRKNYPARLGDVISTRSYKISTCDFIYHAVLPQSGGAGDRYVIRKVIDDVLKLANHHSSRSVAFPALGCGGCGFPANLVAKGFVYSLVDFVLDREVHIEEVKLCIKDASTFKTFKDQFDAAADGVNSMFAVDSDDKENGNGCRLDGDGAMCDITAQNDDKILKVKTELDKLSRVYQKDRLVEKEKEQRKLKKKND